jgi:outer membrane protein assembly factor BamB
MRAWLVAAYVACATLAGCGLFSDDAKRVPTPLVDFKATMAPRVSWSTSVGSSGIYNLAPAIVGTAVYVASADGDVVRIDANNGTSKWRSSLDLKISAGVAANDDLVVVGGPDGDVVALDAVTGKQHWSVKVPGELYGTPVIAGGLVVLRSSDARLFALELANGTRAWTLQRPLPSLVLRADAGMTAYGETLLASFPGGRLLSVSLKTGTVRFDAAVASSKGTTELERIADVVGTPALDGNDACVAAYQGRIACVNAQTGAVLWGREFSSPLSVATDASYVFGVDERAVVHAFVRGSGVSMWSNDKLKDRGLGAPTSWQRAVVVGDYQGYLHFLSRDEGVFIARVPTDGSAVRVAPRLLDRAGTSLLIVQTSAGGVFAIEAQ